MLQRSPIARKLKAGTQNTKPSWITKCSEWNRFSALSRVAHDHTQLHKIPGTTQGHALQKRSCKRDERGSRGDKGKQQQLLVRANQGTTGKQQQITHRRTRFQGITASSRAIPQKPLTPAKVRPAPTNQVMAIQPGATRLLRISPSRISDPAAICT